MKTVRNLYVLVTTTATVISVGLVFGGLTIGYHYDAIGCGWASILLLCCFAGAMGIIVLSVFSLKLRGGVMSIASSLRNIQIKQIQHTGNQILDNLSAAINERISNQPDRKILEDKIKDLQIQVRLAKRQKSNAEAIIYSIRDAVIVTDEFDKLSMANEQAGKLFNFEPEQAKNTPINEIITDTYQQAEELINCIVKSRKSNTKHTKHEITFNCEGNPKTFDCIISCVHDETGGVCGVVTVLHDITKEKEISQMKNDFVSHVSHELKTPLASITAYVEMLVDGEAETEETRKEFYSVIQSQADRLNRLIEDILNISRIESGLIKVDKEPVSLTILIEQQLKMIKSYADEKNIAITAPSPIVFDQVYADKDMISQVIVNLLSNAVKYTKSGGSINVHTEVDESKNVAVVFVADTGVGIPEDEVKHVFDKFYRVKANNKVAKGTGLGLNLVKQIIEKVHNGRVFVESKVGVGSTFGFELPLVKGRMVEAV